MMTMATTTTTMTLLHTALLFSGMLVGSIRGQFAVDSNTLTRRALENVPGFGDDSKNHLRATLDETLETTATLSHRQLQTGGSGSVGYAASFESGQFLSSLYEVNLNTGVLTPLGTVFDGTGLLIAGLTYCEADGEIYALSLSFDSLETLYRLNLATLPTNIELEEIFSFSKNDEPMDPAFLASVSNDGVCTFYTSSQTGTLYEATTGSTEWSPTTLSVTPTSRGGTFDCQNQDLWTASGTSGSLMLTETTLSDGEQSMIMTDVFALGLAFDCCGEQPQLYGIQNADGGTPGLYRIDRRNGSSELVSGTPFNDDFFAFAIVPNCPPPTPPPKCYIDKRDYTTKVHHGSSDFVRDVIEFHLGELCSYSRYSVEVCCKVRDGYNDDSDHDYHHHGRRGNDVDDHSTTSAVAECTSCEHCAVNQVVNDACCGGRFLNNVFKGGCIDRHGWDHKCCKCDGWYDCIGPDDNGDCTDVCSHGPW